MITGNIVVIRPNLPGVAPGTALPAGPAGPPGPPGQQGPVGPQGPPGVGNLTLALLTQLVGMLPTTLPSQPGVLWNNGGILQIS